MTKQVSKSIIKTFPLIQRSTKHVACQSSLYTQDMRFREHDIKPAVDGTCEWLVEDSSFQGWQSSRCGLLWIKGVPGSGKSTLMKYATRYKPLTAFIPQAPQEPLLLTFFFDGRGSENQKSVLGFYRAIVSQAMAAVPEAFNSLVRRFRVERNILPANIELVWHPNILRDAFMDALPQIAETRPLHIFVDAIDELGEKGAHEILEDLGNFLRVAARTDSNIKICFSSRDYPNLFPRTKFSIPVHVHNRHDIELYVRQRLGSKYDCFGTTVVSRSRGIFLWAKWVVDKILDLANESASAERIRHEIRQLPDDLSSLYQDILTSASPNQCKVAFRMFRWICFAKRPLLWDDLRFAMTADPDLGFTSLAECYASAQYITTDGDSETIVRKCSFGLAELDGGKGSQGCVRLIHQSVKDFLIWYGLRLLDKHSSFTLGNSVGYAHDYLFKSCVRLVQMKEINEATLSINYANLNTPFISYAQQHWHWHAVHAESHDIPQQGLLDILGWPSEIVASASLEKLNREPWSIRGRSLLEVAVVFSLKHVLEAILGSPLKRVFQSKLPTSLLQLPMSLLELPVSLLQPPISFLNLPTSRLKQRLVSHPGQAINCLSSLCTETTMVSKDEAVVSILVLSGALVNVADDFGNTPLHLVTKLPLQASVRQMAMIQLLLNHGANASILNNDNLTPLHLAFYEERIVAQLLQWKKTQPNIRDGEGRTILHYATNPLIRGSFSRTVLSNNKINPNIQDNKGRTALHLAALRGKSFMVQILLADKRTKPKIRDRDGRTPLALATSPSVKTLLEFTSKTVLLDLWERFLMTPSTLIMRNFVQIIASISISLRTYRISVRRYVRAYLVSKFKRPSESTQSIIVREKRTGQPACGNMAIR